jgi:phosphate uptake regulator
MSMGTSQRSEMITYRGLDRNFTFMVLETRRQIENTCALMDNPKDELIETVVRRDNYIDTLKTIVSKKALSYFRNVPKLDDTSANMVTAINVVTTNLERIADFCVNVALHIRKLSDVTFLKRFDHKPYFEVLLASAARVKDALAHRDPTLAMQLCEAERRLDELYERDLERIRDELRTGENTDNLLTTLYIFHYLERMGDALLNIGEAVIYASTGEKLKLHEYLRLRDVLRDHQPGASVSDYTVQFNWETHSGTRIGRVKEKTSNGADLEAVFKKGPIEKMRRERDNIERWEQLFPGLTQKVLEYREDDGECALLLEFIEGFTFQDVAADGEREMVRTALALIEEVLLKIWGATRTDRPVSARFLVQVLRRINDVFRLHPDFRDAVYQVGGTERLSFEELVRQAAEVESTIAAPFSVLVHGDLNSDNIIYNPRRGTIHFIDLNRSRLSDYVQDVSIFLVSHFRVPVFQPEVRGTFNEIILRFYRFARDFARASGDDAFDVRLALGLARAFVTSTRFEPDPQFAKVMYMRSVYLLEKVVLHSGRPWEEFSLSREVLVY